MIIGLETEVRNGYDKSDKVKQVCIRKYHSNNSESMKLDSSKIAVLAAVSVLLKTGIMKRTEVTKLRFSTKRKSEG